MRSGSTAVGGIEKILTRTINNIHDTLLGDEDLLRGSLCETSPKSHGEDKLHGRFLPIEFG